ARPLIRSPLRERRFPGGVPPRGQGVAPSSGRPLLYPSSPAEKWSLYCPSLSSWRKRVAGEIPMASQISISCRTLISLEPDRRWTRYPVLSPITGSISRYRLPLRLIASRSSPSTRCNSACADSLIVSLLHACTDISSHYLGGSRSRSYERLPSVRAKP